nr:PF09831 domain protein [Escherichia coli 9.0111]
MAKLTLQEQLLKAGLVTSKKAAKVERTAKKSRVQAREARAAVEEIKRHSLSVINSLANSKNKRRWRKNIKLR